MFLIKPITDEIYTMVFIRPMLRGYIKNPRLGWHFLHCFTQRILICEGQCNSHVHADLVIIGSTQIVKHATFPPIRWVLGVMSVLVIFPQTINLVYHFSCFFMEYMQKE